MTKARRVTVVEDDESVRESLPDLLKEMGFIPRVFSSAEEFLAAGAVDQADCLILDITMPGMSGPDLHQALIDAGKRPPVIYITANEDDNVRARVLALGAVDCLFKPFTDSALKAALDLALPVGKPGQP